MFAVSSVRGGVLVTDPMERDPTIQLNDIRDTNGDINQIRFLLKGNLDVGYLLFRDAVEEQDAISQIQLSHAIHGMIWGKDKEKDFSHLDVSDLEDFRYYPREFDLFNAAYETAMEVPRDWDMGQIRGFETFSFAATQGYLPAVLEVIHNKWKWSTDCFGFGVQLRPFVNQGDRWIDYYYGRALKHGCQIGSNIYYEGLYWMQRSCGISIQYPNEGESFEDFLNEEKYLRYYDFDGFRHLGNDTILVPSMEAWENFVQEKLTSKLSPSPYFQFFFDPRQIQTVMNEYKIGGFCYCAFIETGENRQGFPIETLILFEDYKKIGEIAVRKDTFEIYDTIIYPKIQSVIDFIHNVMQRSGSALSARSWLRQLGASYI